ncbi:MAG TPA: TetR/AcrR family transcriptional regulator [Steroidobacteraceae bacterium]|jgi:AcrR family transcriptional regulator
MTTIRAQNTKRETISRLLAVAEREFGAKGLEGARVDDIARAAGVTKQLVYNYYRSKDELFASLLDEASAQAMSEMVELELDHLPAPQALRTFLNHHFDQYRRYPLLGLTVMEENRQHGMHISSRNKFPELTPSLVEKLRVILERGAATGDFRSGIDPAAFLATSVLITAGCFVNCHCLSVMMGVDLSTVDGMDAWRAHSADFVLAAVRASESGDSPRPSIPRSAGAVLVPM